MYVVRIININVIKYLIRGGFCDVGFNSVKIRMKKFDHILSEQEIFLLWSNMLCLTVSIIFSFVVNVDMLFLKIGLSSFSSIA